MWIALPGCISNRSWNFSVAPNTSYLLQWRWSQFPKGWQANGKTGNREMQCISTCPAIVIDKKLYVWSLGWAIVNNLFPVLNLYYFINLAKVISSHLLYKIAQAKLPEIEAGFQKPFGVRGKVHLEVWGKMFSWLTEPRISTARSHLYFKEVRLLDCERKPNGRHAIALCFLAISAVSSNVSYAKHITYLQRNR